MTEPLLIICGFRMKPIFIWMDMWIQITISFEEPNGRTKMWINAMSWWITNIIVFLWVCVLTKIKSYLMIPLLFQTSGIVNRSFAWLYTIMMYMIYHSRRIVNMNELLNFEIFTSYLITWWKGSLFPMSLISTKKINIA